MAKKSETLLAPIVFPILAAGFAAAVPFLGIGAPQMPLALTLTADAAMIAIMIGAIFAAVHHADVIACRLGEPGGTLVLTLAVTIIEVALIESVVLEHSDSSPGLARDTVFSAVMIVCNGLVGLCVLVGGLRHREQEFQTSGTGVYLSLLGAFSIMTLVLPNYTLTTEGPYFSTAQLIFVSVVTVILYATFLFIQTSRHADYFRTPYGGGEEPAFDANSYPSNATVALSIFLLLLALGGVILIAEKFALVMETGVEDIGAPQAVVGIIIALVVLAPESITAVRAARRDVLQKSLNVALGSSLATIGLTVPAVAVSTALLGRRLALGLSPRDTLLLALTLFLSILTFGTGRTNILSGLIHLLVFATFIFLIFVP
jgi:Ca2+:H+ antiporter